MKIGVVGNARYQGLTDVLTRLHALAERHGDELISEPGLEDCWAGPGVPSEELLDVDALMTFGGDGTLLRGLRRLAAPDTPVLGINLGKVGFLTGASPQMLDDAYAAISSGTYEVEERGVIRGSYLSDAGERAGDTALNDIVMHHGRTARVIYMKVTVDGAEVGQYSADGMIIATPTGSTAYTLSAGGPILTPDVDALIITPISAHTLAVRPLVVPASATIRVELVSEAEGEILISYDGQVGSELQSGEDLRVSRAQHRVKLVRLAGDGFFARMRTKLNWGDLSDRIPR